VTVAASARPSIVGRDSPVGSNEALPLEAVQRRVEGPLSELEDLFRPLLDALGDAPAVHRLELQRLEDEHVERALECVALLSDHSFLSIDERNGG